MTAPGATGQRSAAVRLGGIGLLAAGVAVALYVAGRLHTPNYTFGLFGSVGLDAVKLKSTLASIALGLAVLQVLLALWIYRKLPPACSSPASGLPCTRSRAASSTVPSSRRCCWYRAGGCLAGCCRSLAARSPSSSACSGTPRRSGTT